MSSKSLVATIVVIICFGGVAVAARTAILGGSSVVSLAPAPAMSGAISTGIGRVDGDNHLSQEGQDYKINEVRFFNDKQWAVASIKPLNNNADSALLVFKKVDGVYQTVLGPAGQFTNTYLYVMPPDVGQYLLKQGVIGG